MLVALSPCQGGKRLGSLSRGSGFWTSGSTCIAPLSWPPATTDPSGQADTPSIRSTGLGTPHGPHTTDHSGHHATNVATGVSTTSAGSVPANHDASPVAGAPSARQANCPTTASPQTTPGTLGSCAAAASTSTKAHATSPRGGSTPSGSSHFGTLKWCSAPPCQG